MGHVVAPGCIPSQPRVSRACQNARSMRPNRFFPLLAAAAAIPTYLHNFSHASPPAKAAMPPGAPPAFVLTLEAKQLHWTLDPIEHLKDHINALQFDIPADPAFCRDVKVGTLLDDRFRWGGPAVSPELWPVERALGGQAHEQRARRHDGARATAQDGAATPAPAATSPPPASDFPARAASAPFDPGPAPAL